MDKIERDSTVDIYAREVKRMERMGYTPTEIERSLDMMIRVQNLVTLATI